MNPTYINILGSNCLLRADGSIITQGRITFTPGSALRLGNGAGLASHQTVSRDIANGSLAEALQLGNTALSSPQDVGYTIRIYDRSSDFTDTYPNVLIEADDDGNWNLALLAAGLYLSAVPVVRPITLSTDGSSGPATLIGDLLNIPQYAGGGGGTASYEFSQSTPATTWTITHNLGFRPSVSVTDSAGTEVFGQVQHISSNQLSINFSAPFSGQAYLV